MVIFIVDVLSIKIKFKSVENRLCCLWLFGIYHFCMPFTLYKTLGLFHLCIIVITIYNLQNKSFHDCFERLACNFNIISCIVYPLLFLRKSLLLVWAFKGVWPYAFGLVPNFCCSTCCHGGIPLGPLSARTITLFWEENRNFKRYIKCLVCVSISKVCSMYWFSSEMLPLHCFSTV